MFIRRNGQSLSKGLIEQKSKPDQIIKIHGSFQQLYELLSKQSMPINSPNRKRSSVHQKKDPNPNPTNKLSLKVSYSLGLEDKHQTKTVSITEQNDLEFRDNVQELKKDQKVDFTCKRIKRRTVQAQTKNQRLKNIILGKTKKKSCEGINSLKDGFDLKLQMDTLSWQCSKKRSMTQGNTQKRNTNAYLQQVKRQIRSKEKTVLSEYLKEPPSESKHYYQEQQLIPKLRTVRHQKIKLKGQHLEGKFSTLHKNQKSSAAIQRLEAQTTTVMLPAEMNPQNDLSKCLAQVLMPHSTKVLKREELEILLAKYCSEQQVSEHILWKMQRLQQFYNYFLMNYRCQIPHREVISLPKFSRKNMFYLYYLGPGNNRTLISETMSRRWWWKECFKIEDAHFVWTQDKKHSLFRKSREIAQCPSNLGERSKSKEKIIKNEEIKKILGRQSNKNINSMLFHCFKVKKNERNSHEQLRTIFNEGYYHNHLPKSNILGDKKSLLNLLTEFEIAYKSMAADHLFSFIPETYHIQDEASKEYLQFQQRFTNNTTSPKSNLWIVKPGEDSNRGRNIFLSSNLQEIAQAVKARSQLGGSTIVQEYKSDLLLYKDRKFDIRTFLICIFIGGNCKFYWYSNGYIRTSSHLFNLKDFNTMIHLTNDAIQSQGQQYGKFQKGNKLSYQQLQNYLKEYFPQKAWSVGVLVDRMKDIAKQVARASYCLLDGRSNRNGFEIFGMDFIVDRQFKPWLLEVNTNPCLEVSSPLLKAIIPSLIENVFRLTLDPLYRPSMFPDKEHEYYISEKIIENNKCELIFDELLERDEGWENYCELNQSKF